MTLLNLSTISTVDDFHQRKMFTRLFMVYKPPLHKTPIFGPGSHLLGISAFFVVINVPKPYITTLSEVQKLPVPCHVSY